MTAVLRWLSLVATPPRAWREHLLRNVKPSRYCSRTSGNRRPCSYLYICVSVCFLLIPRAFSACAASSHPPLSHAVVAALVCSRARATPGIWRCWKSKVRRVIMPSAMISRHDLPRQRFGAKFSCNTTAALSGYSEAGGGSNLEVRAVDDGGAALRIYLGGKRFLILLQSAYRCCGTSPRLKSGAKCNHGRVGALAASLGAMGICLMMQRGFNECAAAAASISPTFQS
jgi:hypothetical protein